MSALLGRRYVPDAGVIISCTRPKELARPETGLTTGQFSEHARRALQLVLPLAVQT